MFDFVDNLTTFQIIILTVAVVLTVLLSVFKFTRFFGYVETIIHEFGHAFIARIFGQKIAGLKLRYDTSGETLTLAKKYGIGGVFTHISGYPAPVVVGMLGVMSVFHGREFYWLWMMVFAGVWMMFFIRNFFALIPVFVFLGILFIGVNTGEYGAMIVTVGMGAIMLVFGVKSLAVLWKTNPNAGDTAMLEHYTGKPRRMWLSIIIIYTFVLTMLVVLFSSNLFNGLENIVTNISDFFNNIAKIY